MKCISNFKFFWSAWVTHLGVTDGFGNCKLIVGTLHACAYQPCKNEGLTFNSRSILNYQIWVKYRENFVIYGSNCPIQGWACFNDFSKSIVATVVETFSMYSYIIVPSAHSIKRYGRMRVILDGTSSLKFISNFKFFWSAWVTHLGVTEGFGNFKLLVRTLHTCAYHPCKNEGLSFNSLSILNCQNWVQYRENFEIYGSNCPIQGGACFNDFPYSIAVTWDETFKILSYLMEPSAHLIRRYGRKRVILDGTSNMKCISNFKFFWSAWVTHLRVTDGFGNCKLIVGTLHACAYQPCKNEGLTFNSRSILNYQIWVKYRENFEIYGSNCHIQGWACFNDFSKSIVATGVETFSMYSYIIMPSAHSIKRYGRMRVILDGTSNLKFISNFKFFWSAWVTHLGVTDGFGNCKLIVRTLHTCAYLPCKNESLTFNSRSILNYQIWVKYRENLEIYGSNCPIQGGAYFNDFSKSVVATG